MLARIPLVFLVAITSAVAATMNYTSDTNFEEFKRRAAELKNYDIPFPEHDL